MTSCGILFPLPKRLYLILSLGLVALALPVRADYHLSTQEEVNSFVHNEGELATGLQIVPEWGESSTNITDLSPLAGLTGIKGNLVITGNPGLKRALLHG
ncbi:MAG: hypothetical protein AAFV95_28900 [Bacteroidota bacterium]